MIAIRGWSSSLAQAFLAYLPDWEEARPVERGGCDTAAARHLFAQGLIFPQPLSRLSSAQRHESFEANFSMTVRQCDHIIATNDKARICVVGSESAYKGSFDQAYMGAKAGVHRYVETKKLRTPYQQLVCVSPTIIENSRMTMNRTDLKSLAKRAAEHPKGRFLQMSEVCSMIHFLLYVDEGYTSGTIIRMHGGNS
jgi:NAD(P)-dependent dehydrogenase (short-subunit alcohol dehydrogenase family)